MEPQRGIEPPTAAWQAAVLPLNYCDISFALKIITRNIFLVNIKSEKKGE